MAVAVVLAAAAWVAAAAAAVIAGAYTFPGFHICYAHTL
jgi:hypothetical protein